METKTSRKISVSWNYFETASFIIWIQIFNSRIFFVNTFSEICFVSLPCKAIKYTVEADMLRRNPRVRFKDGNGDTSTGFLSLPSSKTNSNTQCKTLELFVLVRFRACQFWWYCIYSLVVCIVETCENRVPQAPVRDKLDPVVFSLNLSIHEQKPKSRRALQNLDSFPIFSQEQKLTQRNEVWNIKWSILSSIPAPSLWRKIVLIDRLPSVTCVSSAVSFPAD